MVHFRQHRPSRLSIRLSRGGQSPLYSLVSGNKSVRYCTVGPFESLFEIGILTHKMWAKSLSTMLTFSTRERRCNWATITTKPEASTIQSPILVLIASCRIISCWPRQHTWTNVPRTIPLMLASASPQSLYTYVYDLHTLHSYFVSQRLHLHASP